MSSQATPPTVISFGPFQVDSRTQELKKHGIRLRLPGQSFQILEMLLKRPGELVTREELQKVLWPSDTHVDFERGVNAAVNRLRECLGDSADNPHLIETLPRRGYRFIGNVDAVPKPNDEIKDRRKGLMIAAWLVISAACIFAFLFVNISLSKPGESSVLNPVPFTTNPGVETAPTFSPDGSQIAFAWNGDHPSGTKTFDLYVKGIGNEQLLRLTQHPSEWLSPAWSPDGTQIAFHRIAGADTGIYVIPVLGGPERRLRSTRITRSSLATLAWSPDGKWISFLDFLPSQDSPRLYLLAVETLESRQIPHEANCFAERLPAFSHSGEQLAYMCFGMGDKAALYSIEISGGDPRIIATFAGVDYAGTPAWTSDNTIIIFERASKPGDKAGELTPLDGSLRRVLIPREASNAVISARGDKIAYVTYPERRPVDVWRKDLQNPNAAPVRLFPSTRNQDSSAYSPDGRHIVFTSTRGGGREVWLSDADGNHLVPISGGIKTEGVVNWSPDSQKIAFENISGGNPNIYIVDISERVPRKIFTGLREPENPSWSHDGKWIYFSDRQTSRMYRCPAGGGEALLLDSSVADLRYGPVESFDGERIYYAQQSRPTASAPQQIRPAEIYAVSINGIDAKSELIGMPSVAFIDLWTVVPGGIYFVPADAPNSLSYFDFWTKQVRHVFESDKILDGGLSVSPDGRWILYSLEDEDNTDIMLVNHFH